MKYSKHFDGDGANEGIFVSDFPELMKNWATEKNKEKGIDPRTTEIKSNKKIYWRCNEGHIFLKAPIKYLKNPTCSYCSRQPLTKGKNDLATLRPDLVDEWDFDENGLLLPPDVTCHDSVHKIHWKCSRCGHIWIATATDRAIHGRGCTICKHKAGVAKKIRNHALKSGGIVDPKLLADFDYEANDFTPDSVSPKSNRMAFWKCHVCGYKWRAKIVNRANGRGCPSCSNRVVVKGRNDLQTTDPELAAEWDPANDKGPDEVTRGSSYNASWICPKGHHYKATVNKRTSEHTNCPICDKGRHTSFAEQAIFYYVKMLFPDAQNHYDEGFPNGMELDIYVPLIRTGIEFDGIYWHQKNAKNRRKQSTKFRLCQSRKIRLIRIAEGEFDGTFEDDANMTIWVGDSGDYKSFTIQIIAFLRWLNQFGFSHLPFPNVNVERDQFKIRKNYMSSRLEDSLAGLFPEVVQDWDYELNEGLTPDNIKPGSEIPIHWKCHVCGKKWVTTASKRTIEHTGCPECAKKRVARSHCIPIYQYDKEGHFIRPWESTADAGAALKINRANIGMCANGQRPLAGGFRWSKEKRDFLPTIQRVKKDRTNMNGIEVEQLDDDGNVVATYPSMKEASRVLKIDDSQICRAANGLVKKAGGYHWRISRKDRK